MRFDAAATADLPLSYPVVEPSIAHPVHANLGNAIWLEGYELDYDAPLEPGLHIYGFAAEDRAGRPLASGVYLLRVAARPEAGGPEQVTTLRATLLR